MSEAVEKPPIRNPWSYIPMLYFLQGVPVMIVQGMAGTLFKDLGFENKEIALFSAIISWPWVLKMLWGPVVDRQSTKRYWTLAMQGAVLTAILAFGLTFLLAGPPLLIAALSTLFVMAFLSATHDIAADGYFMLAVPQKDQPWFVGVRSASFRLGTIFTTGFLVWFAGFQQSSMAVPKAQSWMNSAMLGAFVYGAFVIYGKFAMPKPEQDVDEGKFNLPELALRFVQIVGMLAAIILGWRLLYLLFGPTVSHLFGYRFENPIEKFGTPLFFEKLVDWGKAKELGQDPVALVYGSLSFSLQLAISLAVCAIGASFTRSLFVSTGMIVPTREFFKTEKIGAVLGFILFFRFGESMISTLSSPFLQDTFEKGGLQISLENVGWVLGSWGVIALTLGGLCGGAVISKFGIKKSIWPMVLSLNIPNVMYAVAGFNNTSFSPEMLKLLVSVDQFGYGFGFSAYLVYLLFVCQDRPMSTSIYAIATGLMAFGAMIAKIISGLTFEFFKNSNALATVGYDTTSKPYGWFFSAVCLLGIPGMIVLFFIPMNKEDMRPKFVEVD